ncbi:MAG: type III-A CRISPR-associated protein Cas10/Csm1 [Thermovirgaceae bacterium]
MTVDELKGLLNDVVIGGLLHDVGKLVQRASGERVNHMEVGARWLEELGPPWESFSWAARHHHTDPRAAIRLEGLEDSSKSLAAAIIAHSDSLSASEREEVTGRWNPDVPLWNIFDRVSINGQPEKTSPRTFFPIVPLDDTGMILPEPASNRSMKFNYSAIENGLGGTLTLGGGRAIGPNWLERVLERYLAFVPSETAVGEGRYPDISLYDHLRTTAMIGLCLAVVIFEEHRDLIGQKDPMAVFEEIQKRFKPDIAVPFLMMEADIRGIQRYIYDIGSKKALRGLRSRSFYIEAMQEKLIFELLSNLGFTRSQLLFVGGGHWIMVLPNTALVIQKIEGSRDEINRRLLKEEGGRLSISMAWNTFSWKTLAEKRVDGAFREMGEKLSMERSRPFKGVLQEALGSLNDHHLYGSCTVCGKRTDELKPLDRDDPDLFCRNCIELVEAGKALGSSESRYLYMASKPEGSALSILGSPFAISEKAEDVPDTSPLVLVLKEPHGNLRKEDDRFVSMPWAGYASDSEIDKIVRSGCIGANKIAALRMDVDNLGRIFSEGLSGDGESSYSLSRVATLSRLLTHFFKINIPHIASKPKTRFVEDALEGPRRMILVYSGGDDLFAIGAWNEIAEFSIDVVDYFSRFTGDNPSVTISGGMIMADDKAPVYQLADSAGMAEEHAKQHVSEGVSKGSLSLFFVPDPGTLTRRPRVFAFNARKELPVLQGQVLQFLRGSKLIKQQDDRRIKLNMDRAFLRRIMALEEMDLSGDERWKIHAAYAGARSDREFEKKAFSDMESSDSRAIRVARVAAQWADYLIR